MEGECSDQGCAAPANWRIPGSKLPIEGDETIMAPKAHGTSPTPVQPKLLYGVDRDLAVRGVEAIRVFAHHVAPGPHMQLQQVRGAYCALARLTTSTRHYAEASGSFLKTDWLQSAPRDQVTEYYDSNTGRPLFRAPVGRSFDAFLAESKSHGWPSLS